MPIDSSIHEVARALSRDLAHDQTLANTRTVLTSEITKNYPDLAEINDYAVEIADKVVGKLVKDISLQKRRIIQRLTKRALREGWDDDTLGAKIAEKVGLDERGAVAVENFREGQIKNGTPKGEARRLSREYAKRLRYYRGTTIARSEVQRVLMQAQRDLWKQQQEEGHLSRYAVRVTRLHKDERLCSQCARENGKRRSLHRGLDKGPPFHPNCRCYEELEDQGVIKTDPSLVWGGTVTIIKAVKQPRDGDGDGWVDDGKPTMRPAPPKIVEEIKDAFKDTFSREGYNRRTRGWDPGRAEEWKKSPDHMPIFRDADRQASPAAVAKRQTVQRISKRIAKQMKDDPELAAWVRSKKDSRPPEKEPDFQDFLEVAKKNSVEKRMFNENAIESVKARLDNFVQDRQETGLWDDEYDEPSDYEDRNLFESWKKQIAQYEAEIKTLDQDAEKEAESKFRQALRGSTFTDEVVDAYVKHFLDGEPRESDEQTIIEAYVNSFLAQWATSSGDHHARSIALQIIAADVFTLDRETVRGITRVYQDSPSLQQKVDAEMDRINIFAQAYFMAQYENTQAHFKELGIKKVRVFRGMKFNELPGWLKELPESKTVEVNTILSPMSSWSTDGSVAYGFAVGDNLYPAFLSAEIDVELILGLANGNGLGCLDEGEIVVLGGYGKHSVNWYKQTAEDDPLGDFDLDHDFAYKD